MSEQKPNPSKISLCIKCNETQASFISTETGKRIYCSQCSKEKDAQPTVSRYNWDRHHKDEFERRKRNQITIQLKRQADAPGSKDHAENASMVHHDTMKRDEFKKKGWMETSRFASSVALRLKVYADREIFGVDGSDDGKGWEAIFNDNDSKGNLTIGDKRRLQKPCALQDVTQYMHLLVPKLSDMMGMGRLSARQVNYLMRFEGCKQQPFHRDSLCGYFVIVPLCNGYDIVLIDGSHVVDGKRNNRTEIFIDNDDQKKTVTLNFGDIFVGDSRLVHAGGPSPEPNQHEPLTFRIPGCHSKIQTRGGIGMNRYSVHMYLDHEGHNVVLNKDGKNETFLVNVKLDG